MVMLSFRIFDMEADSQCRYDYLDIYNGHSNLVQKLGRFCGTFRPGALISTTNTMMLEMVSDTETQGQGFVAYFSGAKPYVDGMWSYFRGFFSFLFIFMRTDMFSLHGLKTQYKVYRSQRNFSLHCNPKVVRINGTNNALLTFKTFINYASCESGTDYFRGFFHEHS